MVICPQRSTDLSCQDKNQTNVTISDDPEQVKPLHDFDYRTTAPILYRPFKKKEQNVTLGKVSRSLMRYPLTNVYLTRDHQDPPEQVD